MTATALALDPALDVFDDVDVITPARPQLRLIEGDGFGQVLPPAPVDLATLERNRRRRFLALLATTVVVLAIAWASGVSITSFGAATVPESTDVVPTVHVVTPGDSYNAIAADLGATDPNAAAQLLRAANGGGELVVGQRLVIDTTLTTALAQAGT